jgi:hypothetical protein
MSASTKYAVTSVIAIATIVGGLWPILEPAGRNGVLAAAAVALPVQVIAFWALNHFRAELNGFLAAWVGGTLVRMAVIAVVAVVVIRSGTEGAVPMLLALAGFFFGLLLLEPVYFRIGPSETVEA